jgi:hypothetical protein
VSLGYNRPLYLLPFDLAQRCREWAAMVDTALEAAAAGAAP